MKDLKVLMLGRASIFSIRGGDTMQVVKTAEYLNKLEGVTVEVKTTKDKVDYSKYDLLHLFNISRPADLIGPIKKSGLPYVVSTIFVDFSEVEKNHPSRKRAFLSKLLSADGLEYLKTIARLLKSQEKLTHYSYLLKGQRKSILWIINNSKLLLPNSHSEYKRLQGKYQIDKAYEKIPNAIDTTIFKEVENHENEYSEYKDAIICVGQITPVKNQENLIKALNNTKYNVFIIGKASYNAENYFQRCKEIAANNIKFIPFKTQDELVDIYKSAKVHALPSWFETTGLVSLEAAYMGCNIVITNKGDQREYFEDDAFYCNPESCESIFEAVNSAFIANESTSLKERIKEQYTWDKTAEKTLKAYHKALKNG